MAKLRSLSIEEIVDGGQESDSAGLRIYSGPILDGKLVVETDGALYAITDGGSVYRIDRA